MAAYSNLDEMKKDLLLHLLAQREQTRISLVGLDAQIADLEGRGDGGAVITLAPMADRAVDEAVEAAMRAADPRLSIDPSVIVDGDPRGQHRQFARRIERGQEIQNGPYPCTDPDCEHEPFKTKAARTRHSTTAHRQSPEMTAPAPMEDIVATMENAPAGLALAQEGAAIEHEYPPYHRLDALPKERCLECSECSFATRRGTDLRAHARIAHGRAPTQYEMTPTKVPDDKITLVAADIGKAKK